MNCKQCKSKLFQKTEGKIKIRTNIIVIEKSIQEEKKNIVTIKCQACKADNEIPLILDTKNEKTKLLLIS